VAESDEEAIELVGRAAESRNASSARSGASAQAERDAIERAHQARRFGLDPSDLAGD
jgi:hypothetical protein